MQTIDDYALERLKNAKKQVKQIRDCHNYEIISNIAYADAFQYTPLDLRDTEAEKITSDMVLKILNLAYIPEKQSNYFYLYVEYRSYI